MGNDIAARGRERAAWAEWISGHEWRHFCGLTFRGDREPTDYGARRALVRFFEALARETAGRSWGLWLTELGRIGRLHGHALVAGSESFTPRQVRVRWGKASGGGWSDVTIYDPERGGRFYLADSLAGWAVDWDIERARRN